MPLQRLLLLLLLGATALSAAVATFPRPFPPGVYSGAVISPFGSTDASDPSRNLTCLPEHLLLRQDVSLVVGDSDITVGPTSIASVTASDGTVFYRAGTLSSMQHMVAYVNGSDGGGGDDDGGVLITRNAAGDNWW